MNIHYLIEKYHLDQLEITILTYLFDHIEELKKIGIRKIAKDNYTSPATVIRLAKRLGYDSYSDMIYSLIFTWKDEHQRNPITLLLEGYPQLAEASKQFCKLLSAYQHKKVIVTGIGFSNLVANYINESLNIYGFNSMTNVHVELLTKSNEQNILLIAISQSGETSRFPDIFEKAYENNIDIISFIGNKDAKLATFATLPIVIDRPNNLNHLTHKPNTFIGEAIIVFEYLLCHYLETIHE